MIILCPAHAQLTDKVESADKDKGCTVHCRFEAKLGANCFRFDTKKCFFFCFVQMQAKHFKYSRKQNEREINDGFFSCSPSICTKILTAYPQPQLQTLSVHLEMILSNANSSNFFVFSMYA